MSSDNTPHLTPSLFRQHQLVFWLGWSSLAMIVHTLLLIFVFMSVMFDSIKSRVYTTPCAFLYILLAMTTTRLMIGLTQIRAVRRDSQQNEQRQWERISPYGTLIFALMNVRQGWWQGMNNCCRYKIAPSRTGSESRVLEGIVNAQQVTSAAPGGNTHSSGNSHGTSDATLSMSADAPVLNSDQRLVLAAILQQHPNLKQEEVLAQCGVGGKNRNGQPSASQISARAPTLCERSQNQTITTPSSVERNCIELRRSAGGGSTLGANADSNVHPSRWSVSPAVALAFHSLGGTEVNGDFTRGFRQRASTHGLDTSPRQNEKELSAAVASEVDSLGDSAVHEVTSSFMTSVYPSAGYSSQGST